MSSGSKKFVFLVQGEGRGHMTQAISLYEILRGEGHIISHVFVGKSNRRKVPGFFASAFHIPVEPIASPNFITDPQNKSIRLIPSIFYNMKFLIRYKKSLGRIDQVLKTHQPDGFINFYDFLGGFYVFFYRPSSKYIVIGHQFLTDHPAFEFAPGKSLDKILFKMNNRLNAMGAYRKLALSFMPYHPSEIGKTTVVPPLLRNQLKDQEVEENDFILGYMVNDGYSGEIITWNKKNPHIRLHIFWDRKGEPEVKNITPTLTFHQLNASKFLHLMARCRGLITTAGFESVCEAMYLGKPVLMIPVKGQYEQACNAIDAVKAGAGIQDDHFNINKLLDIIPGFKGVQQPFRKWYAQGHKIFLQALTDLP